MSILHNIKTISFAIIFIVASIMSIMSVWQLGSAGLKYVLGVQDYCQYYPDKAQECQVDYNALKRDLAQNIALVIVALPVSVFFYRKIR